MPITEATSKDSKDLSMLAHHKVYIGQEKQKFGT